MLRALSPAAFVTLLTNFYRGLKGKFKVPIFAHQELDLYKVRFIHVCLCLVSYIWSFFSA